METKGRVIVGGAAIILAFILTFLGCYWQDINWDGLSFEEAVDCTSTDCHLFAPGKAFGSPLFGTIMTPNTDSTINSNWTTLDTFFKNNALQADPYIIVAGHLGVPDSLVCSLATFSNDTLVIQTGRIYYDGTDSTLYRIRVAVPTSPWYVMDFRLRCPQ